MRVLHVITGLSAGGAEQQLALLLNETRHDAEVVSLTDVGSIGRRIRAQGTPVHALGMRGNRDLTAVRRLAALMRAGDFEVVHLHLYRAAVYGTIAARLARVPRVVTTEHSLGDTHIEGRALTAGIRTLYLGTARLSDVTIAVSETVRTRLADWGVPHGRITVVPNGLDAAALRFDAEARRQARRELGIADDGLVIGSVGRLHPVKRFDALLAAAAPLLRSGARLLLVGHGPEEEGLRRQAHTLGVASQVELAGERDDVARMLAAMDVYAAPSAEETFGLAVLEALAAGLPVVVTQCPALDGIELPEVHRVGDLDDLPAVLERAAAFSRVRPPDERPSSSFLRERFDIRSVAATIDALYEGSGAMSGSASSGSVG